ncbi:MAG: hypothetical protein HFJ60_08000 [Clostridia bacterium]|jgi:hypothetical protein|nr:hypothetical protein [Clostridia bacterium]
MHEMRYQPTRTVEILETGYYMGLLYYILSLGTHPTAYIRVPKDNKFYGKEIEQIEINVHGGITYSEEGLYIKNGQVIDGWFIGWDYGHYGDYLGFEEKYPQPCRTGGKKWTTAEIKREVCNACYQVHKYQKDKATILTDIVMKLFGYENINKIKIPEDYKKPREIKLQSKRNFYKKYGILPEIILDRNGTLVDGFCSYYIAKVYNQKYVKTRRVK